MNREKQRHPPPPKKKYNEGVFYPNMIRVNLNPYGERQEDDNPQSGSTQKLKMIQNLSKYY